MTMLRVFEGWDPFVDSGASRASGEGTHREGTVEHPVEPAQDDGALVDEMLTAYMMAAPGVPVSRPGIVAALRIAVKEGADGR